MSRWEGRESDLRGHRSKFDREPSTKKSTRGGKPATERPSSNLNLDRSGYSDRDPKHHQRLQDTLPLEAPPAPSSKVKIGAGSKAFGKQTNGQHDGTKNSSNPTQVPRSQSYFQHGERGNAAQAGRTTGCGPATERGWWKDSKDQHIERSMEKTSICDTKQRVEISQAKGVDNRVWHHNRFYEIEADRQPPARKRPSFREKKIPADFENADKAGAEPLRPSRPDQPSLGSERREEKGSHNCHYSDKPEMSFLGNREANRGEAQGGSFPLRDRYGGGSTYRGRGPSGARIEKWKHDMFEEANRSPTPKNEDDPIAKVEAFLAS
ncbi:uncharacterized protein LOC114322699 isoform X3 [Camellia sinensis]|uniref:uncharacterized protein LOC114322699 isoform X3 n=1 Tax=Camellia sinensis TaxID=4442 RepID=UPI001035E6BA|nr:uncharacterized protein LOC114322699 isoform X3 [Camellia sinensis]